MLFSEFLEQEHKNILGWCDKEKAQKLYDVIRESKAKLCVEIGIFGGSSFIPQALALRDNGEGLAVGIDPWSNDAALEEMENDANKRWWSNINFDDVYHNFLQKLNIYNLESFTKIHRNKSTNLVKDFLDESIDVLHIDGNHCEKLSYEDSINYFPKVKVGGYIFYDDTCWSENGKNISTEKGLSYLLQFCEKICILGKDCMLMKKIKHDVK